MNAQDKSANTSLSRKIFNTVLVFTVGIILLFSIMATAIYYFTYEREAENELVQQAQAAANHLNDAPSQDAIEAIESQFAGHTRFTLIAEDGTVVFDNAAVGASMENHADRPEVIAAHEKGKATSTRYSKTLETDMVYAAVELENGSIIRLAETRHSLVAFLSNMLLPMLFTVLVVAVLVFLLSRVLTRRIMKPLETLNFEDPLRDKIYLEMNPFLERIDEQQRMLKQQNKELALAESLRRDFSSNVSHEMKTPLQVISGYAELMKNDMIEPSDSKKFAGLIHEEAQAMRTLIDDVLILSRLDESAIGDPGQPIDLYAIAVRTMERLRGFAETNEVELSLTGKTAVFVGSETVAEQMVYNLVENGIRYNHPGGKVSVSIESSTPAGGSSPSAASNRAKEAGWGSGTIVMRVSDTGIGVPHDMKDKIFERFFRVEKSRSKETGGTGLGLAIVKHSVMYHGGAIEVESEPGHGTTFILTFDKDKAVQASQQRCR